MLSFKEYIASLEEHCANACGEGGIRGMGHVTGDVSAPVTSAYVQANLDHTKQMQNSTGQLYSFDDEGWWFDYNEMQKYKSKNAPIAKAKVKIVGSEDD